MRSRRPGMLAGAAVVLLLFSPVPARAHKLTVFASVEGPTIRGSAHFRGGTAAQGITVIGRGPQDRELGRTTTDEQGRFSLEARYRCDYRLVAETSDGHGDEYTVAASLLPQDLPPVAGESRTTAPAPAARTPPAHPAAPAERDLAAKFELLHVQLDQLQKQIADNDDRVRLRDIVGGIGYTLGLTGVAFYVLGLKRRIKSPLPDPLRGYPGEG